MIYARIIVPAVILLPIIFAFIRKRYWGPQEKVVLLYLCTSALFNALAAILAARGINNLPWLHVYTIVEFLLITLFFYKIMTRRKERIVIRWLWILFPVLAVVNIVYLNSLYLYNLIPRSVSDIIILLFCIYFLMKSLSFSAAPVPFFNFAIVVAWLLYFSGSLALFAVSDFIIENKTINHLIWNTHATFVMIMYLIIAIAYYKTGKDR